MRKAWFRLFLIVGALTFSSPLVAQPITLKLASKPTDIGTLANTLESFIQELRASPALNGLVAIEPVRRADSDLLQAVHDGEIDFALVMTGQIERAREAVGPQPVTIFNQPLLFPGLDEVAIVQRSWLGDAALSELANADLLGLAFWNGGTTQFVANEAINNREDLVGRTILSASPGGSDVLSYIGASPVSVAEGEIFPSLERGLGDVAEVSMELSPALSEAFTHLTQLNYRPLVAVLVANRESWYKLPEQARTAIGELAREAGAHSTEMALAANEEARKTLQERGITLTSFEPSERAQFRKATLKSLRAQPEKIIDYADDALWLLRGRSGDELDQDQNRSRRENLNEVGILFATDRNDERKLFETTLKPRFWLGSRRMPGERYCGEATFALAPERPFASENERYFTLTDVVLEAWGDEGGTCLELITKELAAAQADSLLLFVHGFNNSFFDASKRAASLKSDLALRRPVVLWSWPSTGGSALDYRYDKESADFTRPHFRDFVLWLDQLEELQEVSLLSHSMGGKIVIEALESLRPPEPASWPHLHHLVFAAPDVARSIFRDQGRPVRRFADHTTLYSSATDWALWISEKWNQGPRAGYGGGDDIFVDVGLESVDATGVDDRWWPPARHAYVFDRPKGVADLEGLLVRNQFAEQRDLVQEEKDGLRYWLLEE